MPTGKGPKKGGTKGPKKGGTKGPKKAGKKAYDGAMLTGLMNTTGFNATMGYFNL